MFYQLRSLNSLLLLIVLVGSLSAVTSQKNTDNWTVIPGSHPVIFSSYKSNPAPNSKSSLRITTEHQGNYPILKYQLSAEEQNAASYNVLVFYVKTDSLTNLELALEDNQGISSFENIANYLPKKRITADWQQLKYPLRPELLNKQSLKNIYLKIVSNKRNKREIIYLDNFYFEDWPAETTTKNSGFKLHDFDDDLKNSFNAEPQAFYYSPAKIELSTVKQNHYGATGASLAVKFNTLLSQRSALFIPVLNRGKAFNASSFNKIAMQLRVIPQQSITIRPLYAEQKNKQEKRHPLKTTEKIITVPDPFWHNITIPLDEKLKKELVGFYFYFEKNRQGALYLDEIYLQ